MFILYKETYGGSDFAASEAVAVSENLATLETEAARLNAKRPKSEFIYGEWITEYKVTPKKVKVL